jgi:hypothetical protein
VLSSRLEGVVISTYTLAVEAYDEIKGSLPSTFAAPEDDLTPTYGGYNVAARRALRDLGYDVSAFPTAPVEVEDSDAANFRYLLNYYALLGAVATATASASKVKAGPIEVSQSQYQAISTLLAFYTTQVASILGLTVGNQVGISELVYDFELEQEEAYDAEMASEYGRNRRYDTSRWW